jgi:FAD/FMN-containing dehydrogenase
LKRWPGYGIDRFQREPGNLSHVLAGSEGTLAGIFSAELNVVPLPRERGVGLVFFDSVAEAMQATVELLPLRPAAIEHVDRVLLDQTKGQLAFQAARALLDLDARPCESILIVEFFDDAVADRLAALAAKPLGLRKLILKTAAEAWLLWSMRKAGVALLTGCAGDAKPVTGNCPSTWPGCARCSIRSGCAPAFTVTPRLASCTSGPCSTCTGARTFASCAI